MCVCVCVIYQLESLGSWYLYNIIFFRLTLASLEECTLYIIYVHGCTDVLYLCINLYYLNICISLYFAV